MPEWAPQRRIRPRAGRTGDRRPVPRARRASGARVRRRLGQRSARGGRALAVPVRAPRDRAGRLTTRARSADCEWGSCRCRCRGRGSSGGRRPRCHGRSGEPSGCRAWGWPSRVSRPSGASRSRRSWARSCASCTARPRLAQVAHADLPVDPIGRGDPARQARPRRTRLTALAATHVPAAEHAAQLAGVLRAAAARGRPPGPGRRPGPGARRPARPARAGPRRSATGVIDWGDTAVGDPGVDLMVAWAAFDPPEREAFWAPTAR